MIGWALMLEREAGQILVGLVLLLIGLTARATGLDPDGMITPFALGVIARSMWGDGRAAGRG